MQTNYIQGLLADSQQPTAHGQRHFRVSPVLLLLVFFIPASPLLSQDVIYQGRPRYQEGMFSVTAGGGLAKINSEFTDHNVAEMFWGQMTFSIGPYLRLGLQGEKGLLK